MEEGTASNPRDEQLFKLVSDLKQYLSLIGPALLCSQPDIYQSVTAALQSSFNDEGNNDTIAKFAGSVDYSILVIELVGEEVLFSLELRSHSNQVVKSSFALIKGKELSLDSTRPIPPQLQIVSLLFESNGMDHTDEARQAVYLHNMHQVTKHLLAPLAKSIRGNMTTSETESNTNEEGDQVMLLQKRVRELDLALEQCQRGSAIPSISLPVPKVLAEVAKKTTATVLKNHLDRYNASQVDILFNELQLNTYTGASEEQKEEFANEVNKTAKLWPAEIMRQTGLVESTFAGSVEKEMNFWKDLDRKVNDTKEQLDSTSVLLTKLVLKRTNRVSEQLINEAESSLDRSMKIVSVSLSFLRDFPIVELQETTTLHPKLSKCITNCLNHFSKLKHSNYDFRRAIHLLEVLGSVVIHKMMSILRLKNMMLCSMEELRQLKQQCDEVLLTWKTQFNQQRLILKEVAKRRNENMTNLKFDFDALQLRIHQMIEFREQHEKMLLILSTILASSNGDFLTDLSEAYQLLVRTNTDVFDLSQHGQMMWLNTIQQYEKRVEKIEDCIIRILNERLQDCKSADEMFRIFALFNPLFFRPAIRNAVNAFRATLMKSVREDVKRLQDKFRVRYDDSHERVTAELRDIPPLSGRIIWARQIENQLLMLMKRIQDVLGVGWEDHLEGKQLKEVCDELRSYLDTQQIYEEWLTMQLKTTDHQKYNKLKDFLLLIEDDPRTGQKMLKVNFDEKQVVIYKEVKYLEWLLPNMSVAHKTIPSTIKSRSDEAYNRYPIALALESALSSYVSAKAKINSSNAALLTAHLQAVRDEIKVALGGNKRSKWIKWDSKEVNEWVGQLVSKIYSLQERVDDVTEKIKQIEKLIFTLTHCEYEHQKMLAVINSIQSIIDELPMKGLSNVALWVGQLDKRIELVLSDKLRVAIDTWCRSFQRDLYDDGDATIAGRKQGINQDQEASNGDFIHFEPRIHEVVLSNQVLFVQPSLEQTKRHWCAEYHEYISMIVTLPRLIAQRFQVFAEANATESKDYRNILQILGIDILRKPYQVIEEKTVKAKAYVQEWLQYQTLWDASVNQVTDCLERDMQQWQQFLQDIRVARSEIDSATSEKCFGPIVIDHRQAQNKINLKYDTWQKESQARFGAILLQEIKGIHSEVVQMKTRLEGISLEGSTKDAIIGVEYILKSKGQVPSYQQKVDLLKTSEKLLQTQRFTFPSDWLPVSNVSGAFQDMCNILDRRTSSMNAQLPALQQKIKEEDVSIQSRTEKFMEHWNLHKPIEGNITANAAMETLSMYSAQLIKLLEDANRLRGAKESLNMDYISDDRLNFVESEIQDLKEAWSAIAPISDRLVNLSNTTMKDVNPTSIRKLLEELVGDIKNVPAKVRSYAAVETVLDKLQKYLSFQAILRDLCTEALKERHWKTLLEKLDIKHAFKNLTLGIIWESNALQHRKSIAEVLSTAQGELALEQYLRDVREHWIVRELQISTRDQAKIVTGWDLLFATLEDHLVSLASLKQSPYFRNVPEFQEDTVNWETRLTNLRAIFEVWLEVQRKWIYLRGIFRNADIKAQLPAQYSKFKSIDNEYTALMKRVSSKPVVLDILQLDNLLRQLEREDATMTMIQKALGEYLERQRQIFPRFYFVNNDDLIEIIGNSNEPAKIMVHLSKMFAAISSLHTNIEQGVDLANTTATAMLSKEGEVVTLRNPINLGEGVKDWLTNLHTEMAVTLASLLEQSSESLTAGANDLLAWMQQYPAQISVLAAQLFWTHICEEALIKTKTKSTQEVLQLLDGRLQTLSLSVLQDMDSDLRRKCEHLLTEMVHQRDVVRLLISGNVTSISDFGWLYHLRFYYNHKEGDLMQRLFIKMSNASFHYGFEYLGVGERLVQTPLTDRCYLTLTQALHFRMGANPFGPAGTGKTESVKMLGTQLGRFVLVFNCDSSFDYAAMGRIFSGLCQVGAWGCFDEFNRLEERILSAVSQQILTIQRGLMNNLNQIDLLGQSCKLSKDVGIFVTLNPGYAGRSNLPDNLKQLFRAVAMSVPDRKLIAQVMLFSQGIATAEELAGKIVLLFVLCEEQLSSQSHYDFGLRALKSVLVGAGELKRKALAKSQNASSEESKDNLEEMETKVLIKSTCDSVVPKLVAEDIPLFLSLLTAVFPGCQIPAVEDQALMEAVKSICVEECLEVNDVWVEKILQLKQIQDIRHGIMLVGPSGTGKTSTWRTLLKALSKVDGVKGEAYVIDPKSIQKDKLFGSLDPNTLEWTDGIFTKTLRKLADASSVRGTRRSWIVFDGDVDPEWAENLNSVLDDNKILTLPSGDRLKIPNNVRIIMEVDNLQYATLATVSRCGMVWFANGTVTLDMIFRRQLGKLAKEEIKSLDGSSYITSNNEVQIDAQKKFVEVISPYFLNQPSIVETALMFSLGQQHIMEATSARLLETLFCMLVRGVGLMFEYNDSNPDFPMPGAHLENFATKWLLFSVVWSFGSSLPIEKRYALGSLIEQHCNVNLPNTKSNILDLQPNVQDGEWMEWSTLVPRMEIESHKVSSSDVVVTTTDTVRHAEVIKAWLLSRKPLVLCGPPGSGKTMTLTAVLDAIPEFVLAPLNFSSGTTPELILKTFAQYCEVVDSPDGLVLQPNRQSYRDNQWLVVFCDEINLPATDAYGTQRVIMFLRQLTEQGGYWNHECKWIHLRRIQFVGACNPPTDAGRTEMSLRFLRHAPVLLVDYPAETSLKQIYRCFNQALLRMHPSLKGFTDPLNEAMVEFYMKNRERFTADMAPQYIYSPRELSRWVRAMYEAMEPLDTMTAEELVRLWAHEALRLFQDRLIAVDDRDWCSSMVDSVAARHFPGVDVTECLKRPILYSQWIKKTYQSTDREILREFVAARLKVFYEEELDVPLVIFDEVLDHVLRIDNVLRHPMGHLLLVGESGTGKTVLTRFVAWMNGLSIFQIKANNRYTLDQFDEDLRALLRRVGVDGEKICFIFDESNALSSAFLERMNALLASGEIPGLFEGDERTQLMSACRESFNQREGLVLDSEDELYRRFTKMIQRNLHVVFTMNPSSSDFENRCTTSPALFNRCVVDWFGTWSASALTQVAAEFTRILDTGYTKYSIPSPCPESLSLVVEIMKSKDTSLSEAVVAGLVNIHDAAKVTVNKQGKSNTRQHYLSPRDFLDLIRKFTTTEEEKRSALEDQQTHVRTGLQKLLETQDQVAELNHELQGKNEILRVKDLEANSKLTKMVEKQNEAEQRKSIAEQLTAELAKQNEEIRVRKEVVEKELSEAEPALISAKQSVQNIRKAQLDEVRALARPPNAVRLTMEMVNVMIGENSADWTEIRKVIRRDDFITTVVNFDPLSLTPKQIKLVQDNYLSNPELDYNSVDRASKACGPLFQWAGSQIKYATILKKIKPLRDEMAELEVQLESLSSRQQEAVQEVEELEGAIKTYKSEYAAAIRETEIIRSEMSSVSKRVSRANALLASLQEEKVRWEATALSFDQQMSTLIGDCLLSAAFLTYAGIFDHRLRARLMMEWSETMELLGIPFRPELDMVNYLSKPTDQLHWLECGLPNDSLAIQNAILLERYNRFPLVIDPSGQAMKFLLNKFASQKIVTTSFLDAAFLKTLASAIRFGTPLLVQDVESLDPILNPVLNRELQRTGGRTLIRLGNEDIDFSPKFMVILITRNPLARFAPDLCSRVTTINFTITPASLESQVLSEILKSERPDVDKRRSDVLRLQGEQNAKLRELQDTLLNRISQVQGAILDDDSVINTLEGIKADAAKLYEEVSQTSDILDEVKVVSNSYLSLASAIANVYFTLESLSEVSFLYQYSLQFFLQIVANVLKQAGATTDSAEAKAANVNHRIKTLKSIFFNEVSRRVLPGLKYEDKLIFLLRSAQIATQGQVALELTDAEADFLTKGVSSVEASPALLAKFRAIFPEGRLLDQQVKQLIGLSVLPAFAALQTSISSNAASWLKVLDEVEPEHHIPMDWIASKDPLTPERSTLLKSLIIKALRPERVLTVLEEYITIVFDSYGFSWRDHSNFDLKSIVERDSSALVPLMLCSQPGQDASTKVDALATALDKKLLQVSMGSAEGFTEAEKIIAQASKTGSWVLLRNVHLCTDWLNMLEKKLYGIAAHDAFRIFLTCEIHEKLPTALLRRAEVMIFESSSGMKANLQRFFMNIPSNRIDRQPVERGRLYALLAWFNAVVQERLRYAPLGWTKRYEFTDSDLSCSVDVIDTWVDEVAGQRAHVDPQQLPWQALRTLISESLYGGRIDHIFDQISLDAFVQSIFNPVNYSSNAVLVKDTTGQTLLSLPDSLSRSALENWIKTLPDSNPPSWISLPATAERQLKIITAQKALSHLAIVTGLSEIDTASDHISSEQQRAQRVALVDTLSKWIKLLQGDHVEAKIQQIFKTLSEVSTVIGRTLLREVQHGLKVLSVVSNDLHAMKSYAAGESKLTNVVRDLLACYRMASIPTHWKAMYAVATNVPLISWIEDLASRLEHMLGYVEALKQPHFSFSIGKMFSPEAFIIATRQQTAQVNQWSLEDLELYLDIDGDHMHAKSSHDTSVQGLILQGASWQASTKHIAFSDDLRHILPLSSFKWRLKTNKVQGTTTTIPIYINENRKQLVSQVIVSTQQGILAHQWAQRSVAFILQNPIV